jgi:hypothetical protein
MAQMPQKTRVNSMSKTGKGWALALPLIDISRRVRDISSLFLGI